MFEDFNARNARMHMTLKNKVIDTGLPIKIETESEIFCMALLGGTMFGIAILYEDIMWYRATSNYSGIVEWTTFEEVFEETPNDIKIIFAYNFDIFLKEDKDE